MTPTPATPTPTPTATHHSNLASFLRVLEHIGAIALTIAPVVIAPFVKNPNSQAIMAAETPIAQALAGELEKAAGGQQ